jgi:acyl-CoA synthetase (AMP-forming)/AMP-acid ligase II
VTGKPLTGRWRSVILERDSLNLGNSVQILEEGAGGVEVIGCGQPLSNVKTIIVDENEEPLPESYVGEIVIEGPSVGSGYINGGSEGSTRFVGESLYTGDAGFMMGDQLFVLGRLGDSLKIRGRTVFAEDLEAELAKIGIPLQQLAISLGSYRGEPTALVMIERPNPTWLKQAGNLMSKRSGVNTIIIITAPAGLIERTTSGKVKRRYLWRMFTEGKLKGERISLRKISSPL